MKNIAINGFGRIVRAALKIIMNISELDVVAVNDIMNVDNAAYLLQYDSIYGHYDNDIAVEGSYLRINGKRIMCLSEKDPAKLPWKALDIDVVIESTGLFTNKEDAEKHLHAGAKAVVLSGPTKSKNTPTVIHGVNTEDGKVAIFSCASCTTNNIGLYRLPVPH